MAENSLQQRAGLFQMLIRLFQMVRPRSIAARAKKPKRTQDDDLFYENAGKEVLVEYYTSLGRGPVL